MASLRQRGTYRMLTLKLLPGGSIQGTVLVPLCTCLPGHAFDCDSFDLARRTCDSVSGFVEVAKGVPVLTTNSVSKVGSFDQYDWYRFHRYSVVRVKTGYNLARVDLRHQVAPCTETYGLRTET